MSKYSLISLSSVDLACQVVAAIESGEAQICSVTYVAWHVLAHCYKSRRSRWSDCRDLQDLQVAQQLAMQRLPFIRLWLPQT